MALLLEPHEVQARIRLYVELESALERVRDAQRLPEEPPTVVMVDFDEPTPTGNVEMLLGEVCKRAWKSLRESALKIAAERLRKAEEAVRRFEAGEDV